MRARPVLPALLAAFLAAAGCTHPASTLTSEPSQPLAPLPPPTHVGHVFVIVLENEGYAATFEVNPPPSPYLARNLTAMGRLLPNYYGIGHNSLGNYIAMTSGQGPNAATQDDCGVYAEFRGSMGGPDGQAVGQGCVYPRDVVDVGTQLSQANHTWKAYAEDMANSPGSAPTSCRHGALDSEERWGGGSATDQYATRHEPFVYYHGVIDDAASCSAHVVDLKVLLDDLANGTVPEFSFLTPDACSDGHDNPCADPKQPGGFAGIDQFLRTWVPRIMASPAYQKDGLLLVLFDEADTEPPQNAEACCGEGPGPNAPMPGLYGPGGGRMGAVLVSRCLEPGSKDETAVNHYGFLRTVEDIFHLAPQGYAGTAKAIGLGDCAPTP